MNLPGKTAAHIVLFLASSLGLNTVIAQDARVSAELSSPVVAQGESVNLQIVAQGMDSELDTTPLEAEFDVVGRSSSRQVNIVNGKRSSTVIWNIEIQPRRVGSVVVPPVSVGDLKTAPIPLQVTKAAEGTQRQIYIEATVDNEKPLVQSQVIYTLKIYQRVQFSGDSLGYPNVEGVTVQQLGSDKQYTEEVDGQSYAVFERRFVLFPQASGSIEIPPVVLQGSTPGQRNANSGLFTPRKRFTRKSKAITLDVQPRPDEFTGQWWLPATALELSAEWASQAEPVVGQPLTRVIRLVANGVSETQLPEIEPAQIPGVSIYDDASDATTVFIPEGLQAQREFSWAIIPQRAGSLTLPEIKLPWFDVTTGTTQIATIPAETIEILAPANTTDIQTPSLPAQTAVTDALPQQLESTAELGKTTFWKRVSVVLAACWAATLLAWGLARFRSSTTKAKSPTQQKPQVRSRMPIHIAAVEAAVKDADIDALARSINAWGAAAFGRIAASPGDIANRVESERLKELLWKLDAAVYRPAQQVDDFADFGELAGLLRKEKTTDTQSRVAASDNRYALPSL